MIDLRAARAEPERLRAAVARKGAGDAFDRLLEADARWRELVPQVDELRGRPLGTAISARALVTVAALALAGAVVLGVVGVFFWDGRRARGRCKLAAPAGPGPRARGAASRAANAPKGCGEAS